MVSLSPNVPKSRNCFVRTYLAMAAWATFVLSKLSIQFVRIAPSILPEAVVLPLPSNIITINLKQSLESIFSVERELRKGQANDALEGVRIGLANKSLLLLTDVNQSTSTKQSTRAWAGVRNAQSQILQHARSYQRAWHT